MATLTAPVLRYGQDAVLPEPLTLHAGPLTIQYEEGSLRNVRLGPHEVLHQVYAAVRDHNWGTVPGVLHDLHTDRQADSFRITYRSEHQRGDIHFVWQGTISGAPDGTLTFSMAGQALSTFKRNRIGFCVLHPMACAGQPCAIEQVNGERYDSRFPELIAPHQPFMNLRAITHEVLPGVRAEVRMEGDVFEMEDQRNWTDASYKTYCTPLGLPFPVTVEAGTKIQQAIMLRIVAPALRIDMPPQGVRFEVKQQAAALPGLGLGVASHGAPLNERDIERLRALNLSHLRADVRFKAPDWADRFRQSAAEAKALDVGLEIALHLTDNAEADLAAVRTLAEALAPRIARWLVFRDGEKSTTARWLSRTREHLAAFGAPLFAGTDAFFAELNRGRPPVEVADGVTYSVNPLVHA
ncbi:MAG: hypothetical protein IT323_06055, partial [Anaerolineae bacterium]|nr:hypothetical protein [Anaerolineae bacterium]